MTRNLVLRRLLLGVMALLLLGVAWMGWSGGVTQWSHAQNTGQLAQNLTQIAFGSFAFLSLVTTMWAVRWNNVMLAGWVVSATLAAGLAPVVWGDASLLIGVRSGAAGAIVALAIAALLRVGARGLTGARG